MRKLLALLIVPTFAVGMAACDVDQTEEGEAPEVEVEEGQLPSYDVDAPDVDVTEDTVTVPDIDINDEGGAVPEDEGARDEGGQTY